MKLFIYILLLLFFISGCNNPANNQTETETGAETQDPKWKAFKENFPEIDLPYTLKADSNINLIPYQFIDSSYILKYLQPSNLPKEATGIYRYIGKSSREKYTLLLYAYEINGIQGMRLAAYNRKGNKTDEMLFWSNEWLDNPKGKSISQSTLEKDGEIKITVWQYSSDKPTEKEIKSTNPSSKFYYAFEDGRFTNSDETAVEK